MKLLRYCDKCKKLIERGSPIYTCLDCDHFALCAPCFRSEENTHDHLMVKETTGEFEHWARQLAWFESPASALQLCFKRFARRPLFGVQLSTPTPHNSNNHISKMLDKDDGLLFFQTPPEHPKIRLKAHHETEHAAALPTPQHGIHWLTYRAVERISKALGTALTTLLAPGQFVGILAPHAVQFFFADLACQLYGYPVVPLPSKIPDEQLLFMLNDTRIRLLFTTPKEVSRIEGLLPQCPDLQQIILIDDASAPPVVHQSLHPSSNTPTPGIPGPPTRWKMSSLIQLGDLSPAPTTPADVDEINTIVYTSGSTGRPKGILFTNKTWRLRFCHPVNTSAGVTVRFLPLSSESSRSNTYVSIINGGRIGFHSHDNFEGLYDTFKLFRPTFISSVPRLWNQIYADFQAALSLARFQQPDQTEEQLNAQLLTSFRGLLGGRTRYLLSGGAPISPHILDFLECCFQCQAHDGYGISETGGVTNRGRLKPGVEYKLNDVPDLGYHTTDLPHPRGELWLKTPRMFDGYWRPEDAKDKFVDGWFCTGDIVEEIEPQRLQVIDRKDHIYKLAQGLFVAPEHLEVLYSASPLIAQIYIHCDPLQQHLVAIIVPNIPVLTQHLHTQSSSPRDDWSSISTDIPRARQLLLRDIARLAQEAGLTPHEQPRAIHLTPETFSTENQLLTRTLKQHRVSIATHFAAELDTLYNSLTQHDTHNQLISLLRQLLPHPASPQEHTAHPPMDSLTAVQLHTALLQQFQLHLPLSWLLSAPSQQEIIEFVEHGVQPDTPDIIHQFKEDLSWINTLNISDTPALHKDHPHILLTGATGFLGAHLLATLLQQEPTPRISCLIRCKNPEHGLARLKKACQAQYLWEERWEPQLQILPGDLARPWLGMTEEAFHDLATDITSIYHVGASVNHVLPYQALRAPNVHGTQWMLKLAATGSATPFHFVSSVSAVPRPSKQTEEIPEEPLTEDDQALQRMRTRGGYAQSKYISEALVTRAHQRGLHCRIYRPGWLGPHSQTGACNREDTITRCVHAFLHDKAAPRPLPHTGLNIIPVDIACQAILAFNSSALPTIPQPKIIHVVHPAGITPWKSLLDLLLEFDQTITSLPHEAWWRSRQKQVQLHSSRQIPPPQLAPLLPILQKQLPTEHMRPGFSCTSIQQWSPGLKQQTLQRTYFERFFRHLLTTQTAEA